ncbi:RES family NAD+ phosphorylase [Mesorhizobium sp. CA6]|uniref:RES family NAD+ phosphorylase n=1 Tax=Mesorhizobium sp. CA6 TaxID=588500 RepID=UPI001CCE52BB|nr:RES family NAD+ phosphorylase [Mesorhizobium sp. CA6]MBZ9766716.1 RES family NAD+ phosphorylase [Mesorhizobium sp. CA6]
MEEFANRIEAAFEDHYTLTARDPDGFEYAMMRDKEIDYDWERKGERSIYAIMNAAEISEDAAGDIQDILENRHSDLESAQMGEETSFSSEAHYEETSPGDREWQKAWYEFERNLKSTARFFSRTAATQLGALFDDIDKMITRDGAPLIVEAGPGTALTHFFRARAFQSDDKLEKAMMRPDRELSAPPSRFATAGRMNAKGISTFYGSTTPDLALAEVRPPVGSQVAMARFEVIRPLRLLDLNTLKGVHVEGSIFDPNYAPELSRMSFLRKLCDRIARPVMPDDQDFEYLPTQAVADYLATEGKVPLDGILFPSVQAGGVGLNVVLFHKASRCKELDIPRGTELRANSWSDTEDGPEHDYFVIEETLPLPKPKEVPPFAFSFDDVADPPAMEEADYRIAALKIDPASMAVHIVHAVKVETTAYRVWRHRWEKTEKEPF